MFANLLGRNRMIDIPSMPMINMPQNFLLWVSVVIVGAVIGFVIYGCIKGFENTFPDS
jgi:hypothetical protein